MTINRRDFVVATAALGSGALAVPRTGQGASADVNPFREVRLGRCGVRASLIGMGTGMHGGNRQSNQTRLGREAFVKLVQYAYDRGVRFFDCADMYGTHTYVAEALKAVPRDKYVLCTKIWYHAGALPEPDRPDADVCVERFRRELNTDYIDLVLIHCLTEPNWPEQMKRQMDILAELKRKKVIRAHGVSVHSLPAMRAAAASPWVDTVHVRLNPFGDSMDDRNPETVLADIRRLKQAGKGVIAMKLVGEGRYRNDPDRRNQAIRYVLGTGAVHSMIVGFEKPQEVDDFSERVRLAMAEGLYRA